MVSGYESMCDAFVSVEYLTFLAVIVILVCIGWLDLLLCHLKYEYGEIAERLVNYDASIERKTPLVERLRTFVYKHRNWSIYGVAQNLWR
uniref:PKD_channel domain-containing protein n=1 Tax=Steinernema glaseri TaxID=37863 RepID=A0A1I7YR96_9BILA